MTEQVTDTTSEAKSRTLTGKVTSNKCDKTVTVIVERMVKHPVYGKYVKKSRKYLVHDENSSSKVGDMVVIYETKPLSKSKSWVINAILN